MNEFVTVWIIGEERLRYDQTAHIPKATFDRLNAALKSRDRIERRRAEEEVGELFINRENGFESAVFDLEEFEIAD